MPASEQINYDDPVELTPKQIQDSQGTRLSEKAPWETYNEEMDIKMPPELEAAVMDYANNYHEDSNSQQNQEELCRQKEINEDVGDEYRWCTKEEYADIEDRMGKIIHSSELISKLRDKVGLRCWYRQHPHPDKLTLMCQRAGNVLAEPEVGCWVKNGWMPEYTVMGFDNNGVPLAEKYRGWRTALLQLILKGFITEKKAHKVFGLATRKCADRYNSVLYGVRNTRKE